MQHKKILLISLVLAAFAIAGAAPSTGWAKSQASAEKASASVKAKKTVKKTSRSSYKKTKRAASQPAVDNYAALIVDANTGRVLYEKNAGATRYPASLTKMMTLYLTFDAIKRGELGMEQQLNVSAKAAAQPSTNISLKKGDRISVKKAVDSLIVRSANDSALVLAEALGKTEWNFALLMTQKARELGMKNTVFRNPHGLPDTKQHTTAYDMARLAIALRRDFPEYYHYFSQREMSHNGVNYTSHNRLLDSYPGADGLKTGYIRASGFNLVTSARRGGFRLVGVVMGGKTAASRDNEMVNLLDRTFARMEVQKNSVASLDVSEDREPLPEGREIALYGATRQIQ